MTDEEIEKLIEWHEAEASRLADRNIPNVNLDKHQRSASALRQLMQERQWRPIETAPSGTDIIAMDVFKLRISPTWFFAPSSNTKNWLNANQRPWNPTHWLCHVPKLTREQIDEMREEARLASLQKLGWDTESSNG